MIKVLFKWTIVGVGTFIAIVVIAAAIAVIGGDTEDETATAEPAAETTTQEDEMPAKYDIVSSGPDVIAKFEIRESATAGLTASTARRDVLGALKAIAAEHDDYDRAIVQATFPEGGFDGMILNAAYNKDTVDGLDLGDPLAADGVLKAKDAGSAHPDLEK